jgi:hypothetical protein
METQYRLVHAGQESATSQTVDMANGKADFKNEILKLPVNMYFDRDAKCFQEKKVTFHLSRHHFHSP